MKAHDKLIAMIGLAIAICIYFSWRSSDAMKASITNPMTKHSKIGAWHKR